MRQLITVSVIVGCMGVVAGAQQLKVPAGGHEAREAGASSEDIESGSRSPPEGLETTYAGTGSCPHRPALPPPWEPSPIPPYSS